jgi:hypothetical protein
MFLGSQFETGISHAFLTGVLYSAYKSLTSNDSFKNLIAMTKKVTVMLTKDL